jgi:cyclophilin family peptidyl-prolyl cis-trans isomerase
MSVEISTNMGTLVVELYPRDAPRTCRNFVELCKAGYFDGVPFYRLVPGESLHGGCPLGTGTGGESIVRWAGAP